MVFSNKLSVMGTEIIPIEPFAALLAVKRLGLWEATEKVHDYRLDRELAKLHA